MTHFIVMNDQPKKLIARFYETGSGRKPVREWLLELAIEDRRIVGFDIQTAEFGWPLGMPICRSLGSGLWEVRSSISSSRIARVIFCIVQNEMVLLHAFIKKTQQTPHYEIEVALSRRKDLKT